MFKLFIKKSSECRSLTELREIQNLIKEKKASVNKLRCPTYDGMRISEIRDFGEDFARIVNGMISPKEFAARCIFNRSWDEEQLFSYLNKLGNYLVVFANYESQATSIMLEIKELERQEQELKHQLQIH